MTYFGPVALLLVGATISIFSAPDHRAAAGIWKAYFLEPAMAAYVIADVQRTRRDIEKLVGAFFLSGVIVSVFNILTFLYAVGVHARNLVENPPVVIYFSANATGLFLGPLIAIAGALLLYGNRGERTRSVIFLFCALPALLLSFSRGAWLGVILAALFLLWHHRRRLMLSPVVGLALLLALLVPAVRRRIAHELNPSDPFNSVNLRVELWRATFAMMRTGRHPLLGTGLSGFKKDLAPYKSLQGYNENLIYPHNIFLNFYTETGLLGLAAFIWLSVDWVRHTWRSLSLNSDLRPYYLGLAAASICILVHGFIDVPYFKNDLAFLTMALVGLQVAALRQDAPGQAPA